MKQIEILLGLLLVVVLAACSEGEPEPAKDLRSAKNPFPSTYQIPESKPLLIRGATILTGAGDLLEDADVLIVEGVFDKVGTELSAPSNAVVIDAQDKWLTPGLIDVHSHMGVSSAPGTANHTDHNEMTNPVTAQVWAEHSIWPQDPQWEKALAGGITTVQILPGSGNLIGGRGVTLKNVPSTTVQGMKFPGAPYSLKMACGENPRRVYGGKGKLPSTRMGNMAGFRQAWSDAQEYQREWQRYEAKLEANDSSAEQPERNLKLETLVGVLEGEIRIHNHCYRADEMAQMIDMSKEFGYEIAAFHHAVEAYKVAPMLADNGVCAVMWADWWGFKQEAFDMVRENIALVDYAGACAIVHSDDGIQTQRLNQEVAKALSAANRMGLKIDRARAITWLTLNPARSLGLEETIGSIEEGKNADLVLWDSDPFSVYARTEKVWIDGALRYDREDSSVRPTSDFNLGIIAPEEDRP
ncbi:MAG: amidohydrolase family protein [Halioglobus sp.]